MSRADSVSFFANPSGDFPQVDPTAYVDPAARVIGHVIIGANVYVGPYAVIRADEIGDDGQVQPVIIGDESNVQDGVVIHALGGTEVRVGKRTSLAHGCVVHGPAVIGDGCFVGFNAVVYNCVLAAGSFVGTSAVVQEVRLSDNALVPHAGAVLSKEDAAMYVKTTGEKEIQFMEKIINTNLLLTKGYRQ
ncbi:MAG: hypothetical protein FVQ79_06880 [Planctomycetes bacterium]|nr:hypothetical protein [Planctomycetota bacterium]